MIKQTKFWNRQVSELQIAPHFTKYTAIYEHLDWDKVCSKFLEEVHYGKLKEISGVKEHFQTKS